jgi:hypothetical protein
LENLRDKGSRVILHDLFERVRGYDEFFKLALADPPWYPEFYRAFIVRAGEMLAAGGWLFLSMLPRLTRPSAERDRKQVEKFAARAGFRLRKKFGSEATYESPPFELQTLRELGILCSKPWRVADVYLFQKIRKPRTRLRTGRSHESRWLTFRIDGIEVKLRDRPDTGHSELRINSVAGDGKTIGSVSRRDRKRAQIDLWTSTNVGFAISNMVPVKEVLMELESGRAPAEAIDRVCGMYHLNRQEWSELRRLLEVLTRDLSRP